MLALLFDTQHNAVSVTKIIQANDELQFGMLAVCSPTCTAMLVGV